MTFIKVSLAGAVMIMAVILLRALFAAKLPKKTFMALWLVVLCRLLVPISIPSAFSIYNWLPGSGLYQVAAAPISMVQEAPPAPSTANTAPIINQSNPSLPQAGQVAPSQRGLQSIIQKEAPSLTGLLPGPQNPPYRNPMPLKALVTILWGAGAFMLAGYFILTHFAHRRGYKSALPVDNGFIRQWLAQNLGRPPIQVRLYDQINAPLTYGLLHPVILLPKTLNLADTRQVNYILTHEATHIKRRDILIKWLLMAGLCLHWFNPLVWAMYILANRDMEMAVDEAVIAACPQEDARAAYALTLIGLEERRSRFSPLVNSFSKNAIEERIVSIMKTNKTSKVALIAVLTLMLGVTAVFATSPSENPAQNISSTETWALPPGEKEWYTYQEYKAFVDEQRSALPTLIGYSLYNADRGDHIYTQEMVDEDIAQLEKNLEAIKNGTLAISKPYDVTTTDKGVTIGFGDRIDVTDTTSFAPGEETTPSGNNGPSNLPANGLPILEAVPWYTYDEYRALVEKEKRDSPSFVNTQAWNSRDGWHTQTQEIIDERLAQYEKQLEEIKNGTLFIINSAGPNNIGSFYTLITSYTDSTGEKVLYEPKGRTSSALLAIFDPKTNLTYYSEDGGSTWVTQEAYNALYPQSTPAWYTYDEYKAFVEEQRASLPALIGTKAWTSLYGWFVWDKEMVDELLTQYEQDLENIKMGALFIEKPAFTTNGEAGGRVVEGAFPSGASESGPSLTPADKQAQYAPSPLMALPTTIKPMLYIIMAHGFAAF